MTDAVWVAEYDFDPLKQKNPLYLLKVAWLNLSPSFLLLYSSTI